MTADEIQQQMAAARLDVAAHLSEIRDSSETMLDWRYYFRQYPWPMLAAATVLGYMIVPRRIEVVRPDPETLAKLAKREQLIVKQETETRPRKGLGAVAFGLVANALFRAGTAYLSQQAGKVFGREAAHEDGHHPQSRAEVGRP